MKNSKGSSPIATMRVAKAGSMDFQQVASRLSRIGVKVTTGPQNGNVNNNNSMIGRSKSN